MQLCCHETHHICILQLVFVLGFVVRQLRLFKTYLQAFFRISTGAALKIKGSFRDTDNVMYEWIDATTNDYCSWRGVTCDNVTFNVVGL